MPRSVGLKRDAVTRRRGEGATGRRGDPQAKRMTHISTYKELRVYQAAIEAAMHIFEITKRFPIEERYSLTDQIHRCSRSVCSNIAEPWRKRRYPAHFAIKLSDSEGEAEETRVWLEFSWRCGYMTQSDATALDKEYEQIISQLLRMIDRPEQWIIGGR